MASNNVTDKYAANIPMHCIGFAIVAANPRVVGVDERDLLNA